MVRSVIEQDEFDSKMERRGLGGGREGREEADTMVQEKEDEAWAGAVREQRWCSVTGHPPPRTPVPTTLLCFCAFEHAIYELTCSGDYLFPPL